MILKVSQTSQESPCVGVSFLKDLQVEGLQLYLKKVSTQVFPCEVYKIFKNISFCRTPPAIPSAPPVAASVFFLKSN